jgi:hypothetical protein
VHGAEPHERRSRTNAELSIHLGAVRLHGLDAEPEVARNVVIAGAVENAVEDLALAE